MVTRWKYLDMKILKSHIVSETTLYVLDVADSNDFDNWQMIYFESAFSLKHGNA